LRILFLTQIIPYPPDAGPKVKTWQVLRYLANLGHQITLASFTRPEEEAYISALEEICTAVHTVPIRRSRIADVGYWLRSHLTGEPFLVERDNSKEMRRLVGRLVHSGEIDAIHADQLTMAQFALPYSAHDLEPEASASLRQRPLLVFDAHNAVWTIIARMGENAPWFLRPIAALEAARVKQYEGLAVKSFDYTLAVTEPDRQALFQAVKVSHNGHAVDLGRTIVVPIAVDAGELHPIARQSGSMNIVTLGTLHYPPNADGIRWFAKEIFPLVRREIPGATLTIIGKNPPADLQSLAAQNPGAIIVTGYVPNLAPYLEKSVLMVVPVRAGGGMRVRILEAFARAMPVVTTTVGLEGIQAEPGEDVLVADTAESFCRAVVQLLRDKDLQAQLAARGRRLAMTRYDWQVALKGMETIYGTVQIERVGDSV
jgi:polysaccharide biosynthesis protein PslH